MFRKHCSAKFRVFFRLGLDPNDPGLGWEGVMIHTRMKLSGANKTWEFDI